MLGRAGRLKKHDIGLAYLLIEPGKNYSHKTKETEENIAIGLLNGKIKDFELQPDEAKSLTELLAFISMYNEGIVREKIYKFNEYLINSDYELGEFLKKLVDYRLVRLKDSNQYKSTFLGQSIAKSFLTVKKSLEIIEILKKKEKEIVDIVLELKALRNVYLTKKVVADLSKHRSARYSSNNFFSASVSSFLIADNIKKRKSFSHEVTDFFINWTNDIFNCNCKDNPYCDCGRLNLERIIFSLRTDENFDISEISEYLSNKYGLLVFRGDIIGYFENLIYSLESIQNIAKGIINLDEEYKYEISKIPELISKIKNNSE